ncbi:hypothetical protein MRX96_035882 [Rhipicephalus microplus]
METTAALLTMDHTAGPPAYDPNFAKCGERRTKLTHLEKSGEALPYFDCRPDEALTKGLCSRHSGRLLERQTHFSHELFRLVVSFRATSLGKTLMTARYGIVADAHTATLC